MASSAPAQSPLPQRKSARSKAKSFGGAHTIHGLTVPVDQELGNRRKSAVIPAVRSILSGKEDEDEAKKRKDARRKSLANRRVSFAPEATLHTWDVIEYLREGSTITSSSSSSNSSSNDTVTSTNAQASAVSPKQSDSMSESESDMGSPSDQTDTAMSMDVDESTVHSSATADNSTGSSARLDEALRQAARQAGTQSLGYDENGEMSMEMASDEITNAFKPWLQQMNTLQNEEDYPDKENVDPFSGVGTVNNSKWPSENGRLSIGSAGDDMDQSMDISMDITRAVGGIMPPMLPATIDESSETNLDSDTMDLTRVMPGSGILGVLEADDADRRASLKRRRSSSATATASDNGSPAKKAATGRRVSLRTSRRRSSLGPLGGRAGQDETTGITANLSTIQEDVSQQLTTEVTVSKADLEPDLFADAEAEELAEADMTMNAAMDMTVVFGGIKPTIATPAEPSTQLSDEEMSMEMTMALGKIQAAQKAKEDGTSATTGIGGLQEQAWSFPAEVNRPAARAPIEESVAVNETPAAIVVETPPKRTPTRASRRASALNSTPEQSVPATPVADPTKKTPTRAKKTPTPQSARRKSMRHDENAPAQSTASTLQETVRTPQSSRTLQQILEPVVLQQTPVSELPPPVRSPLAPKNDDAMNRMPSQNSLSDSIKQLATPRKQTITSPLRKIIAATTPRTAISPTKSPASKKRRGLVRIASPVKVARATSDVEIEEAQRERDDGPKVSLREFLSMTGIQFMDLTTTKRRHTGFPTLSKTALSQEDDDAAEGDGLDDLERSVVAATALLPELTMYQHSCHEMKAYLSTGKDVVQTIEAGVLEDQPPLFKEYATAPPKERAIMDDQFRAMKTKARLESKGTWYSWRSQLLRDLSGALTQTELGMKEDDGIVSGLEADIESSLAGLNATAESLRAEVASLEQRKAERESGEQEQLREARLAIAQLDADMSAKQQLLQELRQELAAKEEAIEVAGESKEECVAAIKEAERVAEECRGWSTEEVAAQRAEAKRIKAAHHWSVLSATSNPSTMTLAYRDELELFFHPLAFQDARSPTSSPSKAAHGNAPISLTFASRDGKGEPSTVQRFFLQLLRAHLLSLSQGSTPVSEVLSCVSQGWEKCRALVEATRQLDILGGTDVDITGDEQLRVGTMILLPQVDTKVRIAFDVNVNSPEMGSSGAGFEVPFVVKATVVYGERYDEPKMSEFLKTYCGRSVGAVESAGAWADAVDDLKQRLIKRGRKA